MRHRLEIFGNIRYFCFSDWETGEVSPYEWVCEKADCENSHFWPSLYRAYLVPCYSFGETDVYNQETFPEGTWKRFFQKAVQNTLKVVLGLNFCTFHGQGLTKGSWGFLPFNRPITTVGELSSICRLSWSSSPLSPPPMITHHVLGYQHIGGMGSVNSRECAWQ